MTLSIEINNLQKAFDGQLVLQDVSLRVARGTIYGVLGPNGAGKSTLLHLLLGFLRPDHGTIRILGRHNPTEALARIGYLPERVRYHLHYSGREYLYYLGELSGLRGRRLAARVEDEIAQVGLREAADRPLRVYSRGMLQRIGIAQALLHEPELLLIDEPTGGLDPQGQEQLLTLLRALRSRGLTCLVATHQIAEAEALCDQVGILFHGRIATEVVLDDLHDIGRSVTIHTSRLPADVQAILAEFEPNVTYAEHEVRIDANTPVLQAQVLRVLIDAGIAIVTLEGQRRPLEELYLRIVHGESIEPPGMPPPRLPAAAPKLHHTGGDTLLRELLTNAEQQATIRNARRSTENSGRGCAATRH
ncbi:MAG TPA: ABC transporter ATP-binding protein [Roseiflexaceae bacterium]|nr:ABC transporter ATP-binding protein [Roseiflexaceae bacterium]